jgi:transcriptional regulator GlxA family with amidase domain
MATAKEGRNGRSEPARGSKRVVFVVADHVQALDLFGAYEVFSYASDLEANAYTLETVGRSTRPLDSSSGAKILPDQEYSSFHGDPDTLVVTGGQGIDSALKDGELLDWLAEVAGRARRVASLSTGAFLLARAGVLNGHPATTHWRSSAELAHRHPEMVVESDSVFVKSGKVYSSAGFAASMDLALALVEEDLGREITLAVARGLVLFSIRSAGQAQLSRMLSAQLAEREPLRELQGWISDNLSSDLTVRALAKRVAMSQRNFARAFRREIGVTPGGYVEAARLEAARAALEQTEEQLKAIAQRSGFRSVENMRRAFQRHLGMSPSEYRRGEIRTAATTVPRND